MKTINFTKYSGYYSLSEAKEVAKKMAVDIFELEKEQAISSAELKHGKMFIY